MVAGCEREAAGRSVAELERRRDEFLAGLLDLVDRFGIDAGQAAESAADAVY
jgi:carnitine 3-dehydrogenase